VEAALAALPRLTKPLAAMVNLTAGANTELMAQLRSHGVPVLMGTDTALRAISHLNDFSAISGDTGSAAPLGGNNAQLPQVRTTIANADAALSEHDSKLVLSTFGLCVTDEVVVGTADAAVQAADSIGYPVVVKTAEPGLMHKSEAGGIHLNLDSAQAVRQAYTALAGNIGPRVLVQEMLAGGTEMFLGMKSDPQFGPIVLIGMGGIFLEIYKDVVATLPAIGPDEVRSLLRRLQGYPLLTGARGRPPADLDALTCAVLAFTEFVADCGDLLAEVDINPLLVRSDGVTALDALIVPKLDEPLNAGL
jgi:acyl-CoA synthetase (NDP forming)